MMKWIGAVVALGLAVGCASAPDPDPVKHGATLVAQMKAASGGAKLDSLTTYHQTSRLVRDGTINGESESWGDCRTGAFAIIETIEGATVTAGYDGKVGWQLGPDGKPRTESDPGRLASTRLNSYLNTQGYFFVDRFPATFTYRGQREVNGKIHDLVTVTARDYLPIDIDLLIDPGTHRLAGIAGKMGPMEMQGVIDHYEVIDGVLTAKHAMQTMKGAATHTEEIFILSHTYGPVPPERLRVPK
ncbi:MAG: hypothetical protein QM773_18195 [Hyphomonadaceae bacterium]